MLTSRAGTVAAELALRFETVDAPRAKHRSLTCFTSRIVRVQIQTMLLLAYRAIQFAPLSIDTQASRMTAMSSTKPPSTCRSKMWSYGFLR